MISDARLIEAMSGSLIKVGNPIRRALSMDLVNKTHLGSLQEGICYDLAIIGGGIVGTAIAREVKKRPGNIKAIIIEKESTLGKHQSSHNSGVIHSGIYYEPGSLKAKLCVKGLDLIFKYLESKNIVYKSCGKLIIATECSQIDTIQKLHQRGLENGLKDLKILNTMEEIREIEPKCKGFQALWVPATANVDWKVVTEHFGQDFRKMGGDILFNNQVNMLKPSGNSSYPILIKCNDNLFLKSRYLVVCGGLQNGNLSKTIEGDNSKTRKQENQTFISFKVNYQLLENESISTNVYAVPDLDLPFLGSHLSPMVWGGTLLGPTAIPAYKVEGYEEDEINFNYVKSTLNSKGFFNMTKRYFPKCVDELKRHLCMESQIKELQKLCQISEKNIRPGPTAVQAQLLNADGTFKDDFVIQFFEGDGIRKRIINCYFVPSPAATSSLAIAEFVADKFFENYTT